MMRVGFSGTRYEMPERQYALLASMIERLPVEAEFHHGDCIGADKAANDLARARGHKIHLHPPIDTSLRAFCQADVEHPPKTYFARNRAIVIVTHLLLACPPTVDHQNSGGTWYTIDYARKFGRPTILILPNGEYLGELPS